MRAGVVGDIKFAVDVKDGQWWKAFPLDPFGAAMRDVARLANDSYYSISSIHFKHPVIYVRATAGSEY